METKQYNLDSFDENQSFQVIKEMIQVSHKKLKNDGILFILWGWVMLFVNVVSFIKQEMVLTIQIIRIFDFVGILIGIYVVGYSIYYILKQRKKVQTYIGISLRYVWISMFAGMVFINLIQGNVLHNIIFEFQHPIFMLLIAIATVITGGMLRFNLIIFGGIFFGLMALLSSYLPLSNQLICEAIAWLIAFVIPGHYLFAKRNN
jgi:hypothetical protein